jgi:hypothetical protein
MSYQELVSRFLDSDALKEKNREAPDGLKYCNAVCQDYLPMASFLEVHEICNHCRDRVVKGTVTGEPSREPPGIQDMVGKLPNVFAVQSRCTLL